MLDKAYRGEESVEYGIPLASSRFSALHPTAYIHDIAALGGRLYANDRESELEKG